MRRKEKRLLQAVALVLAALVLLPNVGLWALYRERQPDGTPGGSGAAVVPAAGVVSPPVAWGWEHCLPVFTWSLRFLPPPFPFCLLSVIAAETLRFFPFWGLGTLRLGEGQELVQGPHVSQRQNQN